MAAVKLICSVSPWAAEWPISAQPRRPGGLQANGGCPPRADLGAGTKRQILSTRWWSLTQIWRLRVPRRWLRVARCRAAAWRIGYRRGEPNGKSPVLGNATVAGDRALVGGDWARRGSAGAGGHRRGTAGGALRAVVSGGRRGLFPRDGWRHLAHPGRGQGAQYVDRLDRRQRTSVGRAEQHHFRALRSPA